MADGPRHPGALADSCKEGGRNSLAVGHGTSGCRRTKGRLLSADVKSRFVQPVYQYNDYKVYPIYYYYYLYST